MGRIPPILGLVGSSGSGKTTLLERIIPILADRGVRIAVLKHAKAGFELDADPSKDTHRVRSAGAAQVLVASRERWALLGEQDDPLAEPALGAMVARLDPAALDAVLVEGFRHERCSKIEVYRPSHGRPPQCWPGDPDVIAVASDVRLPTGDLPCLDLNDSDAMARFVADRLGLHHLRGASTWTGERCHD